MPEASSYSNNPSAEAPEPEKVRKLFDRLSKRYDCFNRFASLGLDKSWRAALVHAVSKTTGHGQTILDLGTGTGDLILSLLTSPRQNLRKCSLIGMDISQAMLERARLKFLKLDRDSSRQEQASFKNSFYLLCGNGGNIPLADGSVHTFVSAFVLRNIKKIISGVLTEIRRVLSPGGKIFLLEMYVPSSSLTRILHQLYLKTALAFIGKLVFGKDWSGDYLSETILGFGSPSQLSELLKKHDFENVRVRYLTGGIAVLHSAAKKG